MPVTILDNLTTKHYCPGKPTQIYSVHYTHETKSWYLGTGGNSHPIINHCPYCGEDLEQARIKVKEAKTPETGHPCPHRQSNSERELTP